MYKKMIILLVIILTICIPDILFRIPVPEYVLSSSELIYVTFYISRILFMGLAVLLGYSFIKNE